MASVAIVLGSVRPGRVGEQVVRWIEDQARQVEGVQTVFLDLRDYNLPLFAEEMPPSMQAPTLPEAVRLRANLEANDAVLFVTPEYNHSVPAALLATPGMARSSRSSTCARSCRPSVPMCASSRLASTWALTSRMLFSRLPRSSMGRFAICLLRSRDGSF